MGLIPSNFYWKVTVGAALVFKTKLVHHDIIDAVMNMKRVFKKDWFDTAKKLY